MTEAHRFEKTGAPTFRTSPSACTSSRTPRAAYERSAGRVGSVDDHRDQSLSEGSRPEADAQLGRHERMHGGERRSPGQQIHPGVAQLAGTRAGEHAQTLVELDELVHDLQQLRHPLHLIDDHRPPTGTRRDGLSQAFRGRAVEARVLRIDEIDDQRSASA